VLSVSLKKKGMLAPPGGWWPPGGAVTWGNEVRSGWK